MAKDPRRDEEKYLGRGSATGPTQLGREADELFLSEPDLQ